MKHKDNQKSEFDNFFISTVDYTNKISLIEKIKAVGRIFHSFEANKKLENLVAHFKPDIAHLHLVYHQLPISIVSVLKNKQIPIVHTLHDYKPVCPTYSFISKNKICEACKNKKFYFSFLNRCNNNAMVPSMINMLEMYMHHTLGYYDLVDTYITPSKFMLEKLVDFGMPRQKLVHIPNFIDSTKYPIKNKSENYILYVGRLVPVKGVYTLLYAMDKLAQFNLKVKIIGDGPDRKNLEKLKYELSLTNVEFLGYQQFNSILSYLSKCMFTVLPSEWYENCPMSVLESMVMGKPVIGSNIGGIPELINNNTDGLLFEPGNADDLADKINYLFTNHQKMKIMGHNARNKIIMEYNPDIYFQKLENVYKKYI